MIARAKGSVRAQASYGNITVLSLLKSTFSTGILFKLNAVAIGSSIFQFTQAQVNVFVLTAFQYSYLAFTSLVIVAELCTLLCYEVIVLKFR